jgi:hypothetical protein
MQQQRSLKRHLRRLAAVMSQLRKSVFQAKHAQWMQHQLQKHLRQRQQINFCK